MRVRFFHLWIGLLLFAAGGANAQWKAGVAKVDITPEGPIWMAGYSARTKPSEGVRQRLYAKAVALQEGNQGPAVLLTSDLLGFNRQMSTYVAGEVQKRFGLSRDRLVLNASHTHSGPVTGDVLRPAYPLDEEQFAIVRKYTGVLLDKLVDVVGAAIRNLSPAGVSFEQGLAGFAVNRRRVSLRHLPGPVDHDVPVMAVRDPAGKLRAVVFGYACHATVLSDYELNGDWPGYAQQAVEQQNPDATALFVAGCGADANPLPRRTPELAQSYGQILAAAVGLVLQGKMAPVTGPLKTEFETVDIPFQRPPSRADFETLAKDKDANRRRYAEAMLARLDRDGKLPDHYPYPVQVWRFGAGLKFIALGGEVVADYSLRLKGLFGWDDTWVAGYSNDVFAYIPSLRVLKEGGYEGGGAMIPYGQPGPFGAAVEEIIVEQVERLMREAKP